MGVMVEAAEWRHCTPEEIAEGYSERYLWQIGTGLFGCSYSTWGRILDALGLSSECDTTMGEMVVDFLEPVLDEWGFSIDQRYEQALRNVIAEARELGTKWISWC
jgi:hypothetical protein